MGPCESDRQHATTGQPSGKGGNRDDDHHRDIGGPADRTPEPADARGPGSGRTGASLTTAGGPGANHSAFAIDRLPKASAYSHHRTITVNDETAKSPRDETAAVVHGIDFNGDGTDDSVLGTSDLDPALPSEAVNPACEPLEGAPEGAVASGLGGARTVALWP